MYIIIRTISNEKKQVVIVKTRKEAVEHVKENEWNRNTCTIKKITDFTATLSKFTIGVNTETNECLVYDCEKPNIKAM